MHQPPTSLCRSKCRGFDVRTPRALLSMHHHDRLVVYSMSCVCDVLQHVVTVYATGYEIANLHGAAILSIYNKSPFILHHEASHIHSQPPFVNNPTTHHAMPSCVDEHVARSRVCHAEHIASCLVYTDWFPIMFGNGPHMARFLTQRIGRWGACCGRRNHGPVTQ